MVWQIFGTKTSPTLMSTLDTQSNNISTFGIVPCTATGTNIIILTPSLSGYTGPSYANYVQYSFTAPATSTGPVTLKVGSLAALKVYKPDGITQPTGGEIISGRLYVVCYNSALESGAGGWVLVSNTTTAIAASVTPRAYLAGCIMSTAGGSATMSIAAGSAVDSTNTVTMVLPTIAKTTSSWSVGTAAGGLDTGTIANNTWYHFFVIQRLDTNVVDSVFSATATPAAGPTVLPTNYSLYRRIGSGKTDGSAQWTLFVQDGDLFQWAAAVLDVNAAASGTSAVSRTLTVPPGVNVIAIMGVQIVNTTSEGVYLSDLATTDTAAGTNCQVFSAAPAISAAGQVQVRTNTSKQIRSRQVAGGATETLFITTTGWLDARGQNA